MMIEDLHNTCCLLVVHGGPPTFRSGKLKPAATKDHHRSIKLAQVCSRRSDFAIALLTLTSSHSLALICFFFPDDSGLAEVVGRPAAIFRQRSSWLQPDIIGTIAVHGNRWVTTPLSSRCFCLACT